MESNVSIMSAITSAAMPSALAPGCYGAPSVFAQDSNVCKVCPAFQSCSESCIENLKILRQTIDVSDILRRHLIAKKGAVSGVTEYSDKKLELLPSVRPIKATVERKTKLEKIACDVPEDLESRLSGLNAKPRKEALTLIKSGMVELIKSDLAQGRSPYASTSEPNTRSVLCDELLNGKVTKASIKKAYMKRLGKNAPWKESSATSNAAIFVDAFEGLGIIERFTGDDGKTITYKITKEH